MSHINERYRKVSFFMEERKDVELISFFIIEIPSLMMTNNDKDESTMMQIKVVSFLTKKFNLPNINMSRIFVEDECCLFFSNQSLTL